MLAQTFAALVALAGFQSVLAAPLSSSTSGAATDTPLPLIIWHGLGDKYDADGLKATAELAEKVNPGTFVYIIRIDEDASEDRKATYFGNVTTQIERVCEDLANHPILSSAPAVNALGFSQGGQFLRAYVERCNVPPVWNLVTYGGQHNGIAKFQGCKPTDWLCKTAGNLLAANTWSTFSQSRLVPAQYYRNPEDLESYLDHSNFLADINNERPVKNATYKKNLSALHKFVMYVFEEEEVVIPKESSWFAELNATTEEVTLLRNRTIYKEDWIGLKELDKKGGLVFDVIPGKHMQFKDTVLKKTFEQYFAPESGTQESGLDLGDEEWVLVSNERPAAAFIEWEDL